jgi:alkylhydroperoxidase family enzyme
MNQTSKPGPRLAPLSPDHSPELAEQFASFLKSLGFVPNSVLTMQRKPKLVQAFVHLKSVIWESDSRVDRGFKRLIAHVASRVAGDVYSMAHTASGALHFGVPAEKLEAVSQYRASPLFDAAERAALDLAAAASVVPNAVSDDVFAELGRHWNEEEIVEIVAMTATAGFLSRWNSTMVTPLEDEPRSIGEKFLAGQGWEPGSH